MEQVYKSGKEDTRMIKACDCVKVDIYLLLNESFFEILKSQKVYFKYVKAGKAVEILHCKSTSVCWGVSAWMHLFNVYYLHRVRVRRPVYRPVFCRVYGLAAALTVCLLPWLP